MGEGKNYTSTKTTFVRMKRKVVEEQFSSELGHAKR